jgi:hypothetical protein
MDDKNRVYRTTTLGQSGRPILITEYELNEAGQITKTNFIKSIGGRVSSYVYSYDEKNLQVEIKAFDRNNLLFESTKKVYDDKGLLIRQVEFNLGGEVSGVKVYEYSFN